jgi:hypothetical protein
MIKIDKRYISLIYLLVPLVMLISSIFDKEIIFWGGFIAFVLIFIFEMISLLIKKEKD